MNYFEDFCRNHCKYSEDFCCGYCPAYELSEIMENAILKLERKIDDLKIENEAYMQREFYERHYWNGELV
jgi:hypothetical protein